MTPNIRVCPNCGAHVMTGDDLCPRCDYPLDAPPPVRAGSPDIDPVDEPLPGAQEPESGEQPDRFELPTTSLDQPAPANDDQPLESPAIAAPEPETDLDAAAEVIEPAEPVEPAEAVEFIELKAPPEPDLDAADDVIEPAEPVEPAEAVEFIEPEAPPEPDLDAADDVLEPARPVEPAEAEPVPEAGEAEDIPEPAADAADAKATQRSQRESEALINVIETLRRIVTTAPLPSTRPPDDSTAFDASATTRRQPSRAYIIPPAPYTPPPVKEIPLSPPAIIAPPPPPAPAYTQPVNTTPSASAFFGQRVLEYRRGGYELHSYLPYEAILSHGKVLSAAGWLMALVSISGALWYVLILALSGFQTDTVYLTLESDGQLYEDGPGAAHVRRGRARAGRRWSVFGVILFTVSSMLALLLALMAWAALDRYKPELRQAYPEVTLFEGEFSSEAADPDLVNTMKNGVVAFSVLAGIAVVGIWGGLTLTVIGAVHASAYHASVPPLPGWR
ncbi:MAG: hypothetical protein JXJ20_00940 [Anaerolineae bacterium]|nr:hypothetical protein [Anaerolineae bacterium]